MFAADALIFMDQTSNPVTDTTIDQIEEEILTYETSDEALERTAEAATEKAGVYSFSFCTSVYVCPWW
jgi:hypothetical protein